jgi:hypothetical protein
MENMEDFCVSDSYTQGDLLLHLQVFRVLLTFCEVEIRNRKKQEKHKKNEQIAIKKLKEHEKLGGGGGGLLGCNYH